MLLMNGVWVYRFIISTRAQLPAIKRLSKGTTFDLEWKKSKSEEGKEDDGLC